MTALLTSQEAALRLRMSLPTLRRARAQIGFIRQGRKIFFTAADIDAYLATARVAPAPTITQLHGFLISPAGEGMRRGAANNRPAGTGPG